MLICCRAVVAPVQVVELGHDGIVWVAHDQDPAAGELLLDEAGGGVVGLLHDGGAVPPVPHLAPVPAQLQLQVLVYRTCKCWGYSCQRNFAKFHSAHRKHLLEPFPCWKLFKCLSSIVSLNRFLIVKANVGAFNNEKALVGPPPGKVKSALACQCKG